MSTAAEKAAARRKAILSRGSDRLSKLTSSARGEDDPVYKHDDPPLPTIGGGMENFLGEDSPRATPSPQSQRRLPPRANGANASGPAWNEEQQREFMNALMAAPTPPRPGGTPTQGAAAADPLAGMGGADDPFTALMAQFSGAGGAGGMPGMGMGPMPGAPVAPESPRRKTTLQKVIPLIHITATWCLLAYFVLVREPEAFDSQTRGAMIESSNWKRWAELAWRNASEGGWSVQAVPFFWTFMGLQVVLHTFRIFTRSDTVQPPTLLALAANVLPPPIPSLIMNGMKYLRTGGMLLDDLAALVVGIGVVIWVSQWLAA